MKKIRQEKGITLVALIIAIIILLIIAGVTIMAINGEDGIIGKSKQAKVDYEKSQEEEKGLLAKYESMLSGEESSEGGTSGGENSGDNDSEGEDANLEKIIDVNTLADNGNGTFTSSNGVTISIGDYVNYNEGSFKHTPDTIKGAGTSKTGGDYKSGYTLGTNTITTEDLSWRVLGINEQGQLELISADPTSQELFLANEEGYLNAEDNLNNYCNDLYGKGEYVTGGRSLNVEDINKLTKYDPKTFSNKYGSYGQKWMYRFKKYSTYSSYSTDGGATWISQMMSLYRLPGETTVISKDNPGSIEIISTYYQYNISENLTVEDGYSAEDAIRISNIIVNGTGSSNIDQWLASISEEGAPAQPFFGARQIYEGKISSTCPYAGGTTCGAIQRAVRPVVTLSSNITLTCTGNDVGSNSNVWNISQN